MVKEVKIIAECGSNHRGNIELAKKMIQQSKDCGAWAVKFQLYSTDDLVEKDDLEKGSELYDALKRAELSQNAIKELRAYAQDEGIKFGCTAFHKDYVSFLDGIDVDFIKIRAKDASNFELTKLVGKTNKFVYVSLSEQYDYRLSTIGWDLIHADYGGLSGLRTRLLYTCSKYPPDLEDLKLKLLTKPVQCPEPECRGVIANIDYGWDGYGLHYPSIIVAAVVLSFDIDILEVHVKPDNDCIDSKVSFTFQQLKELVECARILRTSL